MLIQFSCIQKKKDQLHYQLQLKKKIDFEDYYFTVGKEYTDTGNIFILPAGNLSSQSVGDYADSNHTHLKHYLEALSRLDFTNAKNIMQKFEALFMDIQEHLIQPKHCF